MNSIEILTARVVEDHIEIDIKIDDATYTAVFNNSEQEWEFYTKDYRTLPMDNITRTHDLDFAEFWKFLSDFSNALNQHLSPFAAQFALTYTS